MDLLDVILYFLKEAGRPVSIEELTEMIVSSGCWDPEYPEPCASMIEERIKSYPSRFIEIEPHTYIIREETPEKRFDDGQKYYSKKSVMGVFTCFDVNSKDEDGNTALHLWAGCEVEDKECVQILLSAGADVTISNNYGDTPLHQAVEAENEHIVKLLIEAGANVSATNMDGETPLHLASKSSIVRALIEAGADTTIRNSKGNSPLEQAVDNNYGGAVSQLVKYAKNDVNAKNENGISLLHRAVIIFVDEDETLLSG